MSEAVAMAMSEFTPSLSIEHSGLIREPTRGIETALLANGSRDHLGSPNP
jgi:hypothetical protein